MKTLSGQPAFYYCLKILTIAGVLISLASCGPSGRDLWKKSREHRMESLREQQRKLDSRQSPGSGAKAHIRLSQLLITFVRDAAQSGNSELLRQQVLDYQSHIEAAYQLISANRDPAKHSRDFRDLEIALRLQEQQLSEISVILPLDERQVVQAALETITVMRDRVLVALFGDAIRSRDQTSRKN